MPLTYIDENLSIDLDTLTMVEKNFSESGVKYYIFRDHENYIKEVTQSQFEIIQSKIKDQKKDNSVNPSSDQNIGMINDSQLLKDHIKAQAANYPSPYPQPFGGAYDSYGLSFSNVRPNIKLVCKI